MIVFAFLIGFYAALHLPGLRTARVFAGRGDKLAWALGATLLVTASSHFLSPETLVAMVPPFLPSPDLLVYVSGAAEMAIAVGLFVRRTRPLAALAAIALFIAVFPANIYATVSGAAIPGYPSSRLYRWLRLPMQLVLIGWALAVYRVAAAAGAGPLRVRGAGRRE